jgi:hypothetical protein
LAEELHGKDMEMKRKGGVFKKKKKACTLEEWFSNSVPME